MGDPVTTALVMQGGTAIMGGMAGNAQAQGEKQRAEANAYIGKTRAINTTASSAESLNDELATLRATFAANGQRPSVGNNAIFDKLYQVRSREGRIAAGNDMSASYDWQRQAQNAGRAGFGSIVGGFGQAAPSIFDLYSRLK
ncbi:MAG: hypothetical protein JWQ44_2918 [Chthoniobacter sp.]|nr:hypothetical protein [Chthoniobacter sp.]